MRAVWITKAGGPEVLEVRESADPEPGRGEVTVRMVLRRSADGWRIESAQRVS